MTPNSIFITLQWQAAVKVIKSTQRWTLFLFLIKLKCLEVFFFLISFVRVSSWCHQRGVIDASCYRCQTSSFMSMWPTVAYLHMISPHICQHSRLLLFHDPVGCWGISIFCDEDCKMSWADTGWFISDKYVLIHLNNSAQWLQRHTNTKGIQHELVSTC